MPVRPPPAHWQWAANQPRASPRIVARVQVAGSMTVASEAYGEGAWAVAAPEHGKSSASKRFSDIGHREANGASF